MMIAILLTLTLVVFTFVFHFRALMFLNRFIEKCGGGSDSLVLVVVLFLFCVHLVEIGAYSMAYAWAADGLGLGYFEGAMDHSVMAYMYYSGVTYTSLGVGDIRVEGHLRFITSIEALNGLLLIAWTASYTYLVMGQAWSLDRPS